MDADYIEQSNLCQMYSLEELYFGAIPHSTIPSLDRVKCRAHNDTENESKCQNIRGQGLPFACKQNALSNVSIKAQIAISALSLQLGTTKMSLSLRAEHESILLVLPLMRLCQKPFLYAWRNDPGGDCCMCINCNYSPRAAHAPQQTRTKK